MKRNSKHSITFIKVIILLFLRFSFIKSMERLRAFYISNNCYYIIKKNSILSFNTMNNQITNIYSSAQVLIFTSEEWEMISLGLFKGLSFPIADLFIIKNIVYAIFSNEVACSYQFNDLNGPLEVYPYNCIKDSFCYYIIGLINSDKTLYLYLYTNQSGYCQSSKISTFSYNVDSENLSCLFMKSPSYNKVLTCLYQSQKK